MKSLHFLMFRVANPHALWSFGTTNVLLRERLIGRPIIKVRVRSVLSRGLRFAKEKYLYAFCIIQHQ